MSCWSTASRPGSRRRRATSPSRRSGTRPTSSIPTAPAASRPSLPTRGRRGCSACPTAAGSSTRCSCRAGRRQPCSPGGCARDRAGPSRYAPSSPAGTTTRSITRTPRSASTRTSRVGASSGVPIPACPRSWRARTAATRISRTGTGTSSTPRSKRAGSTASRTWHHPGVFRWDLARGEAVLILAAEGHEPADDVEAIRVAEGDHRRRFASRLHRAADAYVVRRGSGKTVIAGYPWFTDWGRDTLIALRGLCLATGRFDDARAILLEWSGAVSEGMLPNCFPDHGEAPEFNAVDAALWFVVAVHEFLETVTDVACARPGPSRGRDRCDRLRLRTRHALRDPRRRRRPARRRAARPPAHLDGRQGRRSGRHAADRQARRGAGAVVECAAHRRRAIRSLERPRGARTRVVRGALLERSRRGAARRGRRRSSRRHRRCDDPPEPDLRRGRVALPHPRGASCPARRRHGRVAPAHAPRPPHARPGRARLHAALPGRRRASATARTIRAPRGPG